MNEQQIAKEVIQSLFPDEATIVTDNQLTQIISSTTVLEAPSRDKDLVDLTGIIEFLSEVAAIISLIIDLYEVSGKPSIEDMKRIAREKIVNPTEIIMTKLDDIIAAVIQRIRT